jgi:glycine/D-amino acid oxidase-like deaminating enzyme
VTGRSGSPDVAIIGGGIIGAATAAFLAAEGASVTLYERAAIAAAASGRNSGVIQQPFDPVLADLYRESVSLYRALPSEASFVLPAEPAGLLCVGWDDVRARGVANAWAAIYPETRPEVVSGAALRDLEPTLAPDVVACRIGIGYPVVPAAATQAYAALALARGTTLRIGVEAGLAIRDGIAIGVEVGGRVEAAGSVVVAAGPWSPAIIDPSGAWRPIAGLWGVVADMTLASPPRHPIEEIEIEHEIEPTGDASESAGDVSFTLMTAGGSSSLGSTFLDAEPDPGAFAERLRDQGARFVPEVAHGTIRGLRACARPVALDGRPLVGAVPGIRGAFVAAGNGPWGISTGPATARMIVDLVLGRQARIPDALNPARFGGPGTLGSRGD